MNSAEENPMDSDGSDYSQSSSDEEMDQSIDSESINSDNYDMDDCSPVSRLEIVYDPPKPRDWSEISLEELEQLIQQHRQTNTVRSFLFGIDTDSDYYDAEYFQTLPTKDSIWLSSDGLKKNITYHMRAKYYFSMLGFACKDKDGLRGESKIRLILETGKRFRIQVSMMLSSFCRKELRRSSLRCEFREDTNHKQVSTPLHLLIDNKNASEGAFRIVCNTWPRVVYVQRIKNDYIETMLRYLVCSCEAIFIDGMEDIPRLKCISDIMFEAAEKTKEGARGLIAKLERVNGGLGDYFDPDEYEIEQDEETVFHLVTTSYNHPEHALPIFLKWWPDALKYLTISNLNLGDHPFHNIFIRCMDYESLVKSIEAFMEYSSLDAFAVGLLYDDIYKGHVFDFFLFALESPDKNNLIEWCGFSAEEVWQQHLIKSVRSLLERRDDQGRTLLHYITAYNSIDHDSYYQNKLCRIKRAIQNECEESGRDSHFLFPVVGDETSEEALGVEIMLWQKKRQRQTLEKVGEISAWILKQDPSLAEAVDNDGFNPFQYAVSVGKKWNEGLDVVARLVPAWTQMRGGAGLCPFAIAGYACDEETIFELLRFDSSVLLDFVDDTRS